MGSWYLLLVDAYRSFHGKHNTTSCRNVNDKIPNKVECREIRAWDILTAAGLYFFFYVSLVGIWFPLEHPRHQRAGARSERLADGLSQGLSPNIVLPSYPLPIPR